MKTTTTLATAILALALTGCLAEGPDDATTDEPQTDEITTIAFAPDVLRFTTPTSLCAGYPSTAMIALLEDPQGSLTVTISSGSSVVTVGPPTTFVFDSSNWSLNQAVRLYAPPTAPQQYVTITASAPGANPVARSILVQRYNFLPRGQVCHSS